MRLCRRPCTDNGYVSPAAEYELVRVLEVAGRQGIATDGRRYFVSGSKALYVYSKQGELLQRTLVCLVCVLSSAFYDHGTQWHSPNPIAAQLRPALGTLSGFTFALGLFAAGLTSAITAPLATAYAVCGCLGWSASSASKSFRGIAIVVVLLGAMAAIFSDGSPASTIVAAQIANGLLLPVVAIIMLLVVRRESIVSEGQMATPAIIAAWAVISLITALGIWQMTTGVLRRPVAPIS